MNKKYVFLVLFGLILSGIVFGADLNSINSEINSITEKVSAMEKEGFKVSMISDELFLIKEQYATAREARISGKPYDLSQIDSRITSLSATIDLAYLTRDEIIAVKIEAENTKKEIDVNEAELIIKQAEQEFNDQRYEKAREYVNSAYEKLIELKSFQAKANAAYIAARKNI